MDNVIIDTNVFVTALISRRGASFKLLSLINTGLFDIHLSVPLALEYEDASKRLVGTKIKLTEADIDNVIDYLCSVAYHQSIFYLWRPFLTDPRDEMVLELAVNARCQYIVTYNERDFRGAERFNVTPINPKTYLEQLGVL
jgi:putative PIN family toxin of toxin-antitoxin system